MAEHVFPAAERLLRDHPCSGAAAAVDTTAQEGRLIAQARCRLFAYGTVLFAEVASVRAKVTESFDEEHMLEQRGFLRPLFQSLLPRLPSQSVFARPCHLFQYSNQL